MHLPFTKNEHLPKMQFSLFTNLHFAYMIQNFFNDHPFLSIMNQKHRKRKKKLFKLSHIIKIDCQIYICVNKIKRFIYLFPLLERSYANKQKEINTFFLICVCVCVCFFGVQVIYFHIYKEFGLSLLLFFINGRSRNSSSIRKNSRLLYILIIA